jgi:glycosyltransferase involved in cell wall biosynthesis
LKAAGTDAVVAYLPEKIEMKRILYLSRGGYLNGSQRQLYYVVTNLGSTYEPIVVCREDGPFVSQLRAAGIQSSVFQLHPWRKFPIGLYRYLDAERLVKFARKHNVELVHSSDLWLNEYMLWVADRLKVPSILHVRTPISPYDVRKHRCGKATFIVAISGRVRRNLICGGISPEKIAMVEDGVDLEVFDGQTGKVNILRRDFSPAGEVLIGIAGRIEPSKRQLVFLEAAEQVVRRAGRRATFFVVGEFRSGEYLEELRQFIRKSGLDGSVFFTGRRDDIPEVLGSLDILVSLSGGSVMFEAMSCGKAVISAGFTPKEDAVHIQDGKTGVLVNSDHPSDLAGALLQLIDSGETRKQIGHQARKWAEKNFCHLKMAERTKALYDRLIQRQIKVL